MIYLANQCYASELNVHPKNWKSSRASLKKDWYIYYRFYDPMFQNQPQFRKGKLVVVKGMNQYKAVMERRASTESLIKAELTKLLEKAYNPITMTILEKIKSFLADTTDVSLGYNEINFVQPDNLDEEQIGYSIDPNGNSLITGDDGDWQEQWLVIAADQLGDPIIVDVSSPYLAVLSAEHGEGAWEPFLIADSLDKFRDIISILNNVSKDRSSPEDFQKNPIKVKELQDILRRIEQQNPEAEIWYWENFFEDD